MKEINVDKIKTIKKPKIDAQFGVPVKGRGKLGADNIYIPESKAVKQVKTEKPEQVKTDATEKAFQTNAAEVIDVNTESSETSREEKALVVSEKKAKSVGLYKKNERRSVKTWMSQEINLLRENEESRVVSVKASSKKKLSFSTVATTAFFLVLVMFVAINNVQYFENQKTINELNRTLDEILEMEKKLTAELEQKYDLSEIGDYASSELGMVGSENNKKVYVDIGEDDSVEVYEPETEDFGTIVTIMNALGDTFKAWIDVFG